MREQEKRAALLKFTNLEQGREKLKLGPLRKGCSSAGVLSLSGAGAGGMGLRPHLWGGDTPPIVGAGVSKRHNEVKFFFVCCFNVGRAAEDPAAAPGRKCFYQDEQLRLRTHSQKLPADWKPTGRSKSLVSSSLTVCVCSRLLKEPKGE